MATRKNTFLVKRSNIPGKKPSAGDLLLGELALNTADAILYASGTTANSIMPIGWDRVARTGDTVTGNFNFFGDIKISGSSLPNGYALSVTGDTNFVGDVYVTGDLTYNGNLLVTGGTVVQSGLTANTIYTDYIDFNTNYTGATLPAGRLQWDDGNGTLVLGLKGGISDMEIGLENMALCYNAEATTLTAGTVVYVSGSQGNRPSIKRAIATGDGYSVTTLGVVSESIASGAQGFVTTFGMVNNLNTVGYSGGTPIWLSPTDAGGYTVVKPKAPYHTVLIGYVVRVHASVGSIFVQVSNGWEIDELHDVRLTGQTFGDLLTYSAYNGSNVWVNSKTLNGSYTITGNTTVGGSMIASTVSATTYQNLPTDVFTTGGTYNNITGTATFTNNTGGTFTVTGFSVGGGSVFTGGTITGPSIFIAGLSANTISATTYYNLPTDVRVTGGTYSNGVSTFTNNTGGTFTVTGYNTGTTVGNGTNTYLARWTGSTGLSNSIIRDNGTDVGVNIIPQTGSKFYIYAYTGATYGLNVLNQNINSSYGIYSTTNSGQNSQTAIYGYAQGSSSGNNVGVFGLAQDGLLGIGIKGVVDVSEFGSMTTGIGGYFDGMGAGYSFPTNSYSVQLIDGTEGINKVLVSKTSDGKANWSSILSGLTSVNTGTISATTYFNLPTDVFTTGGTYSNGTAVFRNNTGGTFSVSGFFRTTDDVYTTGMTFNTSNYDLTIGKNDGTSYTQSLSILASDLTVTGGSYNANSGVATFTNNTGGTFTVSGFLTGQTDTYVTGMTFSNNNLTLKQTNNQADVNVLINTMTGLTINGDLTVNSSSQSIFSGNSSSDLVRITQTGSGNALVVEDTTNPDSSPFIVNASGFVGVGTYNPLSKFVISNNNSEGIEMGYAAGLTSNYLESFNRNTGYGVDMTYYISNTGVHRFYTDSNERVRIDTSGNMGIGTTSPSYSLDIQKSTGTGNQILGRFLAGTNTNGSAGGIVLGSTQTHTGYIYGEQTASSTGDLVFGNQYLGSYVENVRILGNGNVGIGTTTPIAKLDVFGNTRINGGLTANTISATTYYNLPTDVFTTGGTYNSGTGVATFTNNTGGTFSVSGFNSGTNGGVYLTGASYSNNVITFTTNSATTSTVTIDNMTGLTVNGTVTATNFAGDGSQLTNVTATVSIPYGLVSAISSGNYLI